MMESNFMPKCFQVEDDNTKVIKIKYLPGAAHMSQEKGSDWIDCYLYEDLVAKKEDYGCANLGFCLQLPQGYECHVVPRSSTFKRYGLIQTNSMGICDYEYNGDSDVYMWPWYATRDITIPAGTRVCQMRIEKNQPTILFQEVSSLDNPNRGGFGSTGR
jgi:dUTP pyrophosphatase